MSLTWLFGIAVAVVLVTVVGHTLWLMVASLISAAVGTKAPAGPRPFRYCPACGEDTRTAADKCPYCGLNLDGRRARDLHGVLAAAEAAFRRRLHHPEGRAALDYLRRRGLTDETIARFGLGWSGEGRGALAAELKAEGI